MLTYAHITIASAPCAARLTVLRNSEIFIAWRNLVVGAASRYTWLCYLSAKGHGLDYAARSCGWPSYSVRSISESTTLQHRHGKLVFVVMRTCKAGFNALRLGLEQRALPSHKEASSAGCSCRRKSTGRANGRIKRHIQCTSTLADRETLARAD